MIEVIVEFTDIAVKFMVALFDINDLLVVINDVIVGIVDVDVLLDIDIDVLLGVTELMFELIAETDDIGATIVAATVDVDVLIDVVVANVEVATGN